MAPIVAALKGLPDADLGAIAHYIASLDPARPDASEAAAMREARAAAASTRARELSPAGARLYEGACAVCHEPGAGAPTFGVRPSLAVASAMASARPDNLIRTILEGARSALSRDLGAMPAFAPVFDNQQVAALARYLRARFASEAAPWPTLVDETARIRASLALEAGRY
jgi:nicotinate dehydrogenase subunit B